MADKTLISKLTSFFSPMARQIPSLLHGALEGQMPREGTLPIYRGEKGSVEITGGKDWHGWNYSVPRGGPGGGVKIQVPLGGPEKTIVGKGSGRRMDAGRIRDFLFNNQNLNFVKRALSPDDYPSIPSGQADGGISTHLMAADEVDTPKGRKFISYPTIIQRQKGGDLENLSQEDAVQYAIDTGEYIEFDTLAEALLFSMRYKQDW